MHTPTHAVVNLALLGRAGSAARSWALMLGAVLPDLPAIVFHVYFRLIRRWPEEAVQQVAAGWRMATTALHAFPLCALLLAVALWRRSALGVALAASLLLHAALDFPVHHGDALRQLWPLSDYRFRSPLSYWDEAHHAKWVRLVDFGLLFVGSWLLWRRHRSRWLRAALVVTNAVMIGVLLRGRPPWSL